jgi:hypothetical protein
MTDNGFQKEMAKPMTAQEFTRLSEFIHTQCGIKMPPGKKIMLEARLQKRLKSVGAPPPSETIASTCSIPLMARMNWCR